MFISCHPVCMTVLHEEFFWSVLASMNDAIWSVATANETSADVSVAL